MRGVVESFDVRDAKQVVLVAVPGGSSTTARLATYELSDGRWLRVHGPVTARVGRNGVKSDRREGDGTTPLGSFGLVEIFGSARRAESSLPYRKVRRGDCWISDVTSPDYNRRVRDPNCRAPNENLWRISRSGPYEWAVVSDFNLVEPIPGKGSAIFLHVNARDAMGRTKPTSGCVSVSRSVLSRVVRWLDATKYPRLVVTVRRDLPAEW